MKWFVLSLLLLSACAVSPDLDPELHGQLPARTSNLDAPQGEFETVAETVEYHGRVSGYLARPVDDGIYPGIVMIHEWWGLNDNIKNTADLLSSEGYIVLAVDLYNGNVADTPEDAHKYMSSVDQEDALANMRAAVTYLKDLEAEFVASLGWCFGGKQSLQLGLAENLDATVIYYGSLETDRSVLASLEQPVLGIFGSEDTSIPVESVSDFEASLNALGVENSIYVYEGANHAFANPSGDRYNEEAAEDAWTKTLDFLEKELK